MSDLLPGLRVDPPDYPGLADGVLRALRLAVIRGDLPVGHRLREQELAQRFGVSRGPVREALQRLEQEGLVRRSQRRGVAVVGLSRSDVEEIYDMRQMIEVQAARIAAVRATTVQIDHLQHLVDTMTDLYRRGRYDLLADADIEFHRQIMLAANHRRMRAAWELSVEPARVLLSITISIRHSLPRAAANHQPIVDAIRARDPDAAAAAMTSHMERARAVILAVMSGDPRVGGEGEEAPMRSALA